MTAQLALDLKTTVLTVLQRHIGMERGITAEALATETGLTKREVRHQVTTLREDGVAVCGHPKTGYFIAANAEELHETCEYLESRAMHSLRLISRLKKIPLPDLVGQLKLNT